MAVLVTGGAGYIGSVTVELLHAKGESVVVLDNLVYGHREAIDAEIPFYQGITDTVTRVLPEKNYAVLKPTSHPIGENMRVHRFAELLNRPMTEQILFELGELMYRSHESYSDCGLGSDGTDLLVKLVKNSKNLYGAKITGGGSGGTVAVLGRKGADAEIAEIAKTYKQQTGYQPYIFSGSSMGAAEFGYLKLEKI